MDAESKDIVQSVCEWTLKYDAAKDSISKNLYKNIVWHMKSFVSNDFEWQKETWYDLQQSICWNQDRFDKRHHWLGDSDIEISSEIATALKDARFVLDGSQTKRDLEQDYQRQLRGE